MFSLNGAANLFFEPANCEFKNVKASISATENNVMTFVAKALSTDHLSKTGFFFSRIINAVTSIKLNVIDAIIISKLFFF